MDDGLTAFSEVGRLAYCWIGLIVGFSDVFCVLQFFFNSSSKSKVSSQVPL